MFKFINPKEAPATMSSQNYNLNAPEVGQAEVGRAPKSEGRRRSDGKSSTWGALVKLVDLLPEQRGKLMLALGCIVVWSGLSMLPPSLIGFTLRNVLNSRM